MSDPAAIDDGPRQHADFLRGLSGRLQAVGGPAAAVALNVLAETTRAHADAIEAVQELLVILEREPTSSAAPIIH